MITLKGSVFGITRQIAFHAILTICLLLLLGWYVLASPEAFRPLLTVSPSALFCLSLLLFAAWGVAGMKFKLLAGRCFTAKIHHKFFKSNQADPNK